MTAKKGTDSPGIIRGSVGQTGIFTNTIQHGRGDKPNTDTMKKGSISGSGTLLLLQLLLVVGAALPAKGGEQGQYNGNKR